MQSHSPTAEINIARTGFQALAGVLGGTQSLHTNSMDETLALPTEKAAEIALRTQQLIAFETGVANVVDPLGGSWFIEELTDKIEEDAEQYFQEIENIGGVIPAIEQGYFQREIARAASGYQSKLDSNQRIMVGVNRFVKDDEEIDIPILEIGAEAGEGQRQKLANMKNSRDETKAQETLFEIQEACKNGDNLMLPIIKAAKAYVTMGEIVVAMKAEFGEWQETAAF
jgi:methylmalonyl-CoA mutase N-terminal domain/subunit